MRCAYGTLILLLFTGSLTAGEPAADPATRLTALIDAALAARWDEEGIAPAPPADDAAFLRRAALDLTGRIPPVSQTRQFLDDMSPGKRAALVGQLVDSPAYVTHFTSVWRDVLVPEGESPDQFQVMPQFEQWLRTRLVENTRYDVLARELLTAPLPIDVNGNVRSPVGGNLNRPASPSSYYALKQLQPEEVAAGVSRTLLGLRLECAQCHDHPFDRWKQSEFWALAAFFSDVERRTGLPGLPLPRGQLRIPDSETVVPAAFLDGTVPALSAEDDPRTALADWVTAPENPYFARATVNRLWGHMFGVGIVEPVDDFGAGNAPSHPELLDALAREFSANGYDVKLLLRAIAGSRAYQLSSRRTDAHDDPPQLFARMAVKGLTPQQLFHSLMQATGYFRPFNGQDPFLIQANTPQSEFMQVFANDSQQRTEQQSTILQALAMMNGSFLADVTSLERSVTLAAIADFPLMTDAERIETLFLAALTRRPTEAELVSLSAYLEAGGPDNDSSEALADIFWVLLNSSEFAVNH